MTKRILRPQWCLLVVFAVLAMDLGLASPAAAQGFFVLPVGRWLA